MQGIRRGMAFGFLPTTEAADAPATLGDADSNQCYATFGQKYILMKVLGGLGASFKKPPTFPRFPVSSFPRR